jgi:hypothetical protein
MHDLIWAVTVLLSVAIVSAVLYVLGRYWIKTQYEDTAVSDDAAKLKVDEGRFELDLRERNVVAEADLRQAELERKAAEERGRRAVIADTQEDALLVEKRRLAARAQAEELLAEENVRKDAEIARQTDDLVEAWGRYLQFCDDHDESTTTFPSFAQSFVLSRP